MGVTAHGVTHPGPRASNEDAFLIDMPGGVFVVADGMGGHNAGEVASGLAVESIRTFVADEDRPSADGLEEAVRVANRHILDTAARRPECSGMGTTVAVALVTPTGAILSSVGDSRIYRMRAGRLTQLTQDDSWIAKLQSEGVIGRWLWLAGYAVGIAVFLKTHSPILFLILLFGLFGLGRTLRGPRPGYFDVEPRKRLAIGAAYFALLALLALGMWVADVPLEPVRSSVSR